MTSYFFKNRKTVPERNRPQKSENCRRLSDFYSRHRSCRCCDNSENQLQDTFRHRFLQKIKHNPHHLQTPKKETILNTTRKQFQNKIRTASEIKIKNVFLRLLDFSRKRTPPFRLPKAGRRLQIPDRKAT